MNKTDKFALTLALTLVFSMLMLSFESFAEQCAAVREDTLRLHIIAKSDDDNDQRLKLMVRDALLEEYSELLSGHGIEQAKRAAEFLKGEMQITAQKTLAEQGCFDKAEVSVVKMHFDTRSYENAATLPAGEYWAVRVVIGEGKGRNWWCVMYPPLCIPAASGEQENAIEQNIVDLSKQPAYQAKFAIVELIEKLKNA